MTAVDAMVPPYNNSGREHVQDDMYHYLTSSDGRYRSHPQANPSFQLQHDQGKNMNFLSSRRLSAEDMRTLPSMSDQEDPSLRLHPPTQSQPYRPRPGNSYQNTQSVQPSVTSAGDGASPSISSFHDQVTPDPYLSDPNYTDYSQLSTPGYDPQLLETPFDNTLGLNGPDSFSTDFPNYSIGSENSAGINSNLTESDSHLQAGLFPADLHGTHLLSPSPTSRGSPASSTEGLVNPSVLTAPSTTHVTIPRSLTPGMEGNMSHQVPMVEQQRSPALTVSPEQSHNDQSQSMPTSFDHPIVKIENYGRDDSPSGLDMSRSVSKRSRRSGTHLSPLDAESSSEDELEENPPSNTLPVRTSPQRDEDGRWMATNNTGHSGVDPKARGALNEGEMPTIGELEHQRMVDDRNYEVQEWVSRVADDSGDPYYMRRRRRPRAKSANDVMPRHRQGLGVCVPDDFAIPGPGVLVEVESEPSEYEDFEASEEEDHDEDQGSETPVANVSITTVGEENPYFPSVPEHDPLPPRPWDDPSYPQPGQGARQPSSSNAAIMRYYQRTREFETASIAATLGSLSLRRRSESDMGSVYHAGGITKSTNPEGDLTKGKDKRERKPSSWKDILPRRPSTNLLKRKGSPGGQPCVSHSPPALSNEPNNTNVPPNRSGSWGRSPKLDTTTTTLTPQGNTGLGSSATSPMATIKNAIRRTRSRSDLGKSSAIAELMRNHGGPPALSLATPSIDADAVGPSPNFLEGSGDDEDAEYEQEPVPMNLKVRLDPPVPNPDGFRAHATKLNPRLEPFMIERITQEQIRRYKRLQELKVKHLKAIQDRNCSSKGFCLSLGGKSKILPPRASAKDTEHSVTFRIALPGEQSDTIEGDNSIPAQFPDGIPIPPVKRLPAEFECPLCFKVKKFQKPSDWTKHVHEDVQPFTCTFPNCGEPKSFKRKADWVRHENERHRQLECWTCNMDGCQHVCHRKDNFVQHLVREHKIPEPRGKHGRANNAGSNDLSSSSTAANLRKGPENFSATTGDSSDWVWGLVENCRSDTTKKPTDEKCRFCGNVCNSWKKLTVHLAKHMEQISLPVLPLVDQKPLNADTIISPIEKPQVSQRSRASSSAAVLAQTASGTRPSFGQNLSANTFPNALSPAYSNFSQDTQGTMVSSTVMHTYPPPHFPHKVPQPQQQPQMAQYIGDTSQNFIIRSYPGVASTTGNVMEGRNNLLSNSYAPSRISPVITPVTDQQQMFHSPVEAPTSYGTELPVSWYTGNTGMDQDFSSDPMGSSATVQYGQNGGQFQQSQYQQMPSSFGEQQPDYPYQPM